MTPALAWRLPKRPVVAVELAAARARFFARVGLEATTLTVHPGERVEAGGLVVVESRGIRPGCWEVGRAE